MTVPPDIPPEWRHILKPGERILWQGTPRNDAPNEKTNGFEIVIGIVAMVVMPFVFLRVQGDDTVPLPAPIQMLIVAAAMTTVFYFSFGHRMFAAYKIRHSFYTLTSKRAITGWTLFGNRHLDTWDITPRTKISLKKTTPGTPGSVYFAEKIHHSEDSSWTEKIGFLNIPDAQAVYDLMLHVQKDQPAS